MIKFLHLTFLVFISSLCSAQLNVELLSQVDYPNNTGNDVWGYIDDDGSEYAIFGTIQGVSVVNITDAENPVEVDFISQQPSFWRDIKTWGDYAYVTSDEPYTTDGLLVIDMTSLPDSITYRNVNLPIPGEGILNTCHNLYIDEFGFLYLAGCSDLNNGGLIILDVATTPGDPAFVSLGAPEYSHDVYVRDNIAYSSELNIGEFAIYDVTDKDSIILLAKENTPFNFSHNAWLSDDSNTLFTTDELPDAPVASYDISDLNDIKLLDEFRPQATVGTGVIPHNVHVYQNWLVISYYSDGCIIVDATKPDNLVEVGNFDTFLPDAQGFNGAWGAFPFLPSGNIIIGDLGTIDPAGVQTAKLVILGPDYVRASYMEGQVTNAVTGNPINGVQIEIPSIGIKDVTNALGEYKTGSAVSGEFMATASLFGYESITQMVTLENGEITIADFKLNPAPRTTVSVNAMDVNNQAIGLAKINISKTGFSEDYELDANGNVTIDDFVVGSDYQLQVGAWGYKYNVSSVDVLDINNTNEINISLEEGYEDNFELDLGWEVESMAFQGEWERDLPIGIMPQGAPIEIAPGLDSDDEGDRCYITGNSNDLFGGLLFGQTTLKSPLFDATAMLEPAISYSTWFWSSSQSGGLSSDVFEIYLDNGSETVRLDSLEFDLIGIFTGAVAQEWNNTDSLKISDYITPTKEMQLVVTVAQVNQQGVVEGGFDGFSLFDVGVSSSVDLVSNDDVQIYPNPSQNAFYVDVPERFRNANSSLDIFDLEGRLVRKYNDSNASIIRVGDDLEQGMYFIQFVSNELRSKAKKIIKQ